MNEERKEIWGPLVSKFPIAYERMGKSLIKEFIFCRDVIDQNEWGYRRGLRFRINLIPKAIKQMAVEFEKIAIKELILKFR